MFLSAKIEESVVDLSVKEWEIFTNTPYTIPYKIGCTSAIETSFIALGLHNLCIRLAAPRQSKQVSLRSVCTIFVKDVIKSNAENNSQFLIPNCRLRRHCKYRLFCLKKKFNQKVRYRKKCTSERRVLRFGGTLFMLFWGEN